MSTSIAQFLLKATGPKNMCTRLRQKTRPLKMLLRNINSVSLVQTVIPQGVFGGDIFTLMSGRLKEQLQYQGQTQEADSVVSPGNPRFFATHDIRSGSETVFKNTILKSKKESSFPQLMDSSRKDKKAFQSSVPFKNIPKTNLIDLLKFEKVIKINSESWRGREQITKAPIFKNGETAKESGFKGIASSALFKSRNGTQTEREFKTLSEYRNAPSIIGKDIIINKGRKRNSDTVTSIFISKLQDYWQLNQKDQNSKKGTGRLIDKDIKGEKGTVSFALPPAATLSQRIWPERIGKQVAQKIHSLSFGKKMEGDSRRIQQTNQSQLPEKFDQDIFNIDVKAESDRGMDFTRDLSEKIADILRDQALQHGIDIT